MRTVNLPKGKYFSNIEVDDQGLHFALKNKKKVALLFISLNDRYWPYLSQVLKDCRQYFLPQHHVDYFVWTDYNEDSKRRQLAGVDVLYKAWIDAPQKQAAFEAVLYTFSQLIRLYSSFYPQQMQAISETLQQLGLTLKMDVEKAWIESTHEITENDVQVLCQAMRDIIQLSQKDMDAALEGVTISDTEPVAWPAPTLMRYHLFLNQEEKLKDYDYVFYMDADMRIVSKISDEIIGEGLTAAEHPMYSLRREYVPPYEPNSKSTAHIKRPGKVVDENGRPRFKPYYYAGGFQGGTTKSFIRAMKTMKGNIDKDFNNNYIAIWNDESHWNKYLSEHEPAIVLSPSYIYPDSLIKEYYEKVWGTSYEPKIITLTKPFTLSSQGAADINKFLQQ